ncbi:LOW QUALITY PROTEIN: endothelin-converting enzyme homolog [Drosophila ficusphila]|uniref:LOW QUALITY PROTEIN: endothelin-converting enzyme homolog n=1 Tax=Drosophila ficusphila TaxID=30025 RepID=UPI0007E8478E|nr:LOW QUALITY PROTEIN: endothelin-converting enzyme homolog [Drosophila ficusphila]
MTSWVLRLCLLIAAVPFLVLAKPSDTGTTDPSDDLTSEYAKQIIRQAKAAEMLGFMSPGTAPCDDFYTYACGNWHRHNPAQVLGSLETDAFRLFSQGLDRRLARLLRSPELKSELERKMQRFFQSCTLVHRDDVQYHLALENVLLEFGQLPALAGAQWNASDFSWWRTVAQIQRKYGKQIILGVEEMKAPPDSVPSENSVYISAGDALSRALERKDRLQEPTTFPDLQQLFGLSSSVEKHTTKQLEKFDKELADQLTNPAKPFEEAISVFTVNELEQKYRDHLNFTEFLGLVLGEENIPEMVFVFDEGQLLRTLLAIRSTPPAVVANYVLLRLLEEFLLEDGPEDLGKRCVRKTKEHFAQLATTAVYQTFRSPAAEAEVFAVWEQIKGIFRQQLSGDRLDWISNATRTLAIDKLDRMQLNIRSYEAAELEELFGAVSIDRANFVPNIQQLLIAKAKRPDSRIYQPSGVYSSASYHVDQNNVSISVALLQPRYLWAEEYPVALKYATLGFILAHEMLHGFDSHSWLFDVGWWDEKSRYGFEERLKCFRAQYHQFSHLGKKLPEMADQSENVADNGAVRLAYGAYQRWLEQRPGKESLESLEGLSLDGRQLFFLGFGQLMCHDVNWYLMFLPSDEDTHSPQRFRVTGSLSNFQEFSWVFNCSRSAPMDPEFKCAIY